MCNGMIISNILYRYIFEVGFTHFKPFLKGNVNHLKIIQIVQSYFVTLHQKGDDVSVKYFILVFSGAFSQRLT